MVEDARVVVDGDFLADVKAAGDVVLGCLSSVLIWFVFWIHLRARRHVEESLPKYRLPIEAIAVLLVGLTGHLGGFLSGVNGPG